MWKQIKDIWFRYRHFGREQYWAMSRRQDLQDKLWKRIDWQQEYGKQERGNVQNHARKALASASTSIAQQWSQQKQSLDRMIADLPSAEKGMEVLDEILEDDKLPADTRKALMEIKEKGAEMNVLKRELARGLQDSERSMAKFQADLSSGELDRRLDRRAIALAQSETAGGKGWEDDVQAVKELAIKLKLNVGKGGLVAFAEELLSEMKKGSFTMNDRFRGMLKVLRSDMEKLQGQYDVIGNEAKTQLETLRKSTEGLESAVSSKQSDPELCKFSSDDQANPRKTARMKRLAEIDAIVLSLSEEQRTMLDEELSPIMEEIEQLGDSAKEEHHENFVERMYAIATKFQQPSQHGQTEFVSTVEEKETDHSRPRGP